ncbi:hypothetical protein [Clostridium perfringens]|uniref:hypothetical protein n=1 Tax=Clostridium perfringens TaxID=1502 RepID=UPI0024BD3113|nr:hypothetical protein [Clostridium perfringens]
MTKAEKNLLRTLAEILEELENDEEKDRLKEAIDMKTRDLSNIELRDTLNCVVMALLDIQNQIIKASGVMQIVKLEEEAKAKVRALEIKNNRR